MALNYDPLSLNRCSINTATLGHRSMLTDVIERVAQAGYGAIAPWRHNLEFLDVVKVAKQIRDAGLTVSSLCRSDYLTTLDHREFKQRLANNRMALAQAAELGAQCFVIVSGGLASDSKDLPAAREQVEEGLAVLLEASVEYGVPIALEPLHPMYAADRSCINTLSQALDFCERLDPNHATNLGIAVDVYHCWWDPEFELQVIRAGEEQRLLGFHLSDWKIDTCDLLMDRGMMGDGVIDLPRLRNIVERNGYTGPIEVEIFSRDDWWQRPEQEILLKCSQRLVSCC